MNLSACSSKFAGSPMVVVGGREPDFPLYEPLVEAGINVERVGDCFGARTTEEAVHEATVVALAG